MLLLLLLLLLLLGWVAQIGRVHGDGGRVLTDLGCCLVCLVADMVVNGEGAFEKPIPFLLFGNPGGEQKDIMKKVSNARG